MTFYDETRPLCLETNAFGFGLVAGLLQIRNYIKLPMKHSTRQHYSEADDIHKQESMQKEGIPTWQLHG